jgi:serine/threonine protein kinase
LKTCNACHRLFPDDGAFCPVDGKPLVPTTQAEVPSDPDDKRVGSKLCGGRYHVWRRVADGGMGRVYQAIDLQEGRSVALKILHPEVAQDGVSVERFKREFEFSAALPHDHIVEVLAFEKTEDQSYALVMEYLEGEELRTLLKREKTISPARVVRMMAQAAIALSAAHDRKIVHRDMKPDNIFLCGSREGDLCKILDFGSVRDNSVGAKKLTVMGTTIGSPFYMSPIIYECLTGSLPFKGSTGPAILLAILSNDPPAPSEAGKAQKLPPTLDPVIEEALAKNAAIRTPTIGALADKLGGAFGLEGSHQDWARTPEKELAERIEAALPALLERHAADLAQKPAPAMDDAFKAGSEGGPSVTPFSEDLVMGVPSGPPKWIYAVVAGAVLLGAVVAFLIVR